jgi:hypothetical protein
VNLFSHLWDEEGTDEENGGNHEEDSKRDAERGVSINVTCAKANEGGNEIADLLVISHRKRFPSLAQAYHEPQLVCPNDEASDMGWYLSCVSLNYSGRSLRRMVMLTISDCMTGTVASSWPM